MNKRPEREKETNGLTWDGGKEEERRIGPQGKVRGCQAQGRRGGRGDKPWLGKGDTGRGGGGVTVLPQVQFNVLFSKQFHQNFSHTSCTNTTEKLIPSHVL